MSQMETLPPAPNIPGPYSPEDFAPTSPVQYSRPPGVQPAPMPEELSKKTTDQMQAEVAQASQIPEPEIADYGDGVVHLPGGWIKDGEVVKTALVRELNGYDEERLSRLNMIENPAIYVTEMLSVGVEDLGGEKPTKNDLRSLLIGDRDALWLGIRIATYGPEVEYTLECQECDTKSAVTIDLNEDVPVKELDDPHKQEFEVELRRGVAKVKLLTGEAQEKSSENLAKRTQAEINTIMLANSVTEINGIPTRGSEDKVRALSSQDRGTIMDFIIETQPGPQIGTEIEVNCSKCNAPFPIVLSPPSLFRF